MIRTEVANAVEWVWAMSQPVYFRLNLPASSGVVALVGRINVQRGRPEGLLIGTRGGAPSRAAEVRVGGCSNESGWRM